MKARLRDTEIYFDIDGSGLVPDGPQMRERPAIFLIHGGPGIDHSYWKRPQSEELKKHFQLVYFDHRGQGRSERGDPSKYTLDENVEDMEALRQYLGLGPIISFGASYGGVVAMAHAARYPASVSRLVLAVTFSHAGFAERAMEIVAEGGTKAQIEQCEALFFGRLDTEEKMRDFFEVMGPLYSRSFDLEVVRAGRGRMVMSPDAIKRGFEPEDGFLRSFDLRPELGAITAPTLVLGGRHDWICAPEFSEEIHRYVPNSELHISEKSAHSFMADDPGTLDLIVEFLLRGTEGEE